MNARVVVAAGRGAVAWREAVSAQRTGTADHSAFYALAGELVDTLRALESLARLLADQVAGYGEGRSLRDDEGMDPAERIVAAVAALDDMRVYLGGAVGAANRFWPAIGHVAAEDIAAEAGEL